MHNIKAKLFLKFLNSVPDSRFPYKQCKYVSHIKRSLRMHMQRVHNESLYYCNLREYMESTQDEKKKLLATSHAGGKSECDQCEYGGSKNQ